MIGPIEQLGCWLGRRGIRALQRFRSGGLDRISGIGLGAANPSASRRAHWRGENRLGHILTKLRADLRAGVAAQKAAQLASSLGLAKRFG